jgi:hypothetical protein
VILAGLSSQADSAAIPDRYDVRKADPAKVADLAESLAGAFYDDPLFSWPFPDASRRLTISRRGFDLYLRRVWLRHEETYTVGIQPASASGSRQAPGSWELASNSHCCR